MTAVFYIKLLSVCNQGFYFSEAGLVGRTEVTLYNLSIKDFVGKTDLCNCWKGKIREAVTEAVYSTGVVLKSSKQAAEANLRIYGSHR